MGGGKNLTLEKLFALINVNVPEKFKDFVFPSHLATDSRNVIKNGAFVALEGAKTDGHNFIKQALENGASLLIIKEGKNIIDVPEHIPVIKLKDPEKDLARLASLRLKNYCPENVIAITGSVGKTSTRAALEKVLSTELKTHSPEKSFNTLIGCTATILAMDLDTQALILEFGANKPGEIEELTNYFAPSTVILTSVNPVHLEGFKSVEGVLNEKLKITASKNLQRIIFNNDNELLHNALIKNSHAKSVGQNSNSDYVINFDEAKFELPALKFNITHANKTLSLKANVWGEHMSYPLSLAVATGVELGLRFEKCVSALNNFEALGGRGRIIFYDDNQKFLIDDAYNANPASMSASLKTFNVIDCENKVAVLGEMRELGNDEIKFHAELFPLLKNIEHVILTGKLWREAFANLENHFEFVDTWPEALELVKRISWRGLLVKGSNSIGLSNIVKALS